MGLSDLRISPPQSKLGNLQWSYAPWRTEAQHNFGNRLDGTRKGTGFYGVLKRPDGKVSTEVSIGVELDGKEVQIPTLVPGLSQEEIDVILSGKRIPRPIIKKAVEHARKRMEEGLSPFWQEGEDVSKPYKENTTY